MFNRMPTPHPAPRLCLLASASAPAASHMHIRGNRQVLTQTIEPEDESEHFCRQVLLQIAPVPPKPNQNNPTTDHPTNHPPNQPTRQMLSH